MSRQQTERGYPGIAVRADAARRQFIGRVPPHDAEQFRSVSQLMKLSCFKAWVQRGNEPRIIYQRKLQAYRWVNGQKPAEPLEPPL